MSLSQANRGSSLAGDDWRDATGMDNATPAT